MQNAFFIRTNGRLKFIPFDDVLYIEAKNNYCEIVTEKKKKWLSHITMNYMEQKLPSHLFLRTHRSYIISLKKIDWLDCNSIIIGEQKIPISKTGYKALTQQVLFLCPEFDNKTDLSIDMVNDDFVKKIKRKDKRA